jgi:protein-S-isoprenylcysteine O-methyltransferase Ste14
MSERPTSFRRRGSLWVIAQLTLLLAVALAGPWSTPHPWVPNGSFGRLVLILSGILALLGFLHLGHNLTPHPAPRSHATLVQHGIYGWIRHPLYTSLMLGAIGWALLWQSIPALVVTLILILVLDAKARVEEHWLRERFPDYAEYAGRVRRFVPWLY